MTRRLLSFFGGLASSRALGHVDKIEQGVLYGWAYLPKAGQQRCLVDVFVDDAFTGQVLANLRRDDLVSAGIGDGAHGFALDLRHAVVSPQKIEAFALGPKRTALPSMLCSTRPDKQAHPAKTADYLRATFGKLPQRSKIKPQGLAVRSPQPFYELLVAPASTPGPPVCLGTVIGAYQDFVRHQWQQAELFEPSLAPSQYTGFLGWYLSTYGRMRGPMRAPLSASDIEFLNRDAEPFGVSLAQKLFANLFAAAPENASDLENAFVWSAYNAAVLSVEDCLVREAHHRALAEIAAPRKDEPYPLTSFMLLFLRNNPFLNNLPCATVDERAFIYFVVLLFATVAPHFLRYVPSSWRDELLETKMKGGSLFDRLSTALFATERPNISAELWVNLIAARGFDTKTNDFATKTAQGSRIYAAALDLSTTETVDVQVIGPFTRALGVQSSCHRLVRALQLTNYKFRICDFSVDHPNRLIEATDIRLSQPGLARVNILHLNLEELPKAVAYGPDVFSGTYNVALPYLELAPPSPAQMLGLSLVDEIWGATRFIADTIKPFAEVFVIGASYDNIAAIGRTLARERAYGGIVSAEDFVFLTAGDALSAAHRKNPLGAARAFLHAFPRNPHVRLVIKTHSTEKAHGRHEQAVWRALRELSDADNRISLFDTFLDEATHYALIEGADAFVSLHRAEGLGYHILEAMALGTPVIATAYSGNVDFCTDETAFLVPYRLIPVEAAFYPGAKATQSWAEPDHSAAVEQMRRVYTDHVARKKIIASARHLVADKFATETFASNVRARLDAIALTSKIVT